jgi:hypothetical protein
MSEGIPPALPSVERARFVPDLFVDTTNLDDLDDICEELESCTVFSLRAETLRGWAAKLRMVRQQVGQQVGQQQNPNSKSTKKPHDASERGDFNDQSYRSLGASSLPMGERSMRRRDPHGGGQGSAKTTFASHVSSATHLIVDNICHMVQADWVTCFVYNDALKKLVLVAGAGKKQAKPGEVTITSKSGLESLVMENGIAIGIGMPSAEEDLGSELEANPLTRSKCVLCFPLFKPGSSTTVVGVLEAGKAANERPFSSDDENRFAECAFLLAHLVSRFPSDLTNTASLDSSIFAKPPDANEHHHLHTSGRQPQLIYRTGFQHPRKADVAREAQPLARAAGVQNVMEHTAFVSEAWRSSVLLNIELEHEVRRLHEALRVARREIARLQGVVNEKKGKGTL